MHIADPVMGDEAEFEALLVQIRASIDTAVRDVLTAEPERMVMGMSAETFWGGVEGNAAFEERIRDRTGLPVTTGASACRAALAELGVRRIAVFSPYQPNRRPGGGPVLHRGGLRRRRDHRAALRDGDGHRQGRRGRLRDVVREIDGPGVEAIVQVGTNLSFVAQADRLEAELGKPVVAINAATLWHALREHGLEDRVSGSGSLLRDH